MSKKENKNYNDLLKNSITFAIGTFGTKVLQFLIVPIYTFVLTTSEYGKIDLFTTTISLFIPFSTLVIQEAVIRYLTTGEISNNQAIGSSLYVFIYSCLFSVIASLIYGAVIEYDLAVLFFICLVLNSYVSIFQDYLKACGQTADFTKAGLLNTFVFLVENIILLTVIKLGMWGYLYSRVLSLLITSIYITIRGKIFNSFRRNQVDKKILKNMLLYSIPLIPNGFMWWIMGVGDRYIVNFYLGSSANGIYSISAKLGTIISTIFGIFMQAWQLSAIKESNKENVSEFYSTVFRMLMAVLFISTSLLITFTRPLFKYFIGANFMDSNLYSPLLCTATVISCISTFLAVSYIVSTKTKGAFTSTLIGAILNIIVNLLLIKSQGILGVVIGTIVSYMAVCLIRIKDMKKYVDMDFDYFRTITSMIMLLFFSFMYIYLTDIQTVVIGTFLTFIISILYKKEIMSSITLIKSGITNRYNNKKNSWLLIHFNIFYYNKYIFYYWIQVLLKCKKCVL